MKEKKNVWLNIYRLVKPYRKKLVLVCTISLLATAVTLLEPLIYREAVNDITGLFVQQARNDVFNEMGGDTDTDEAPVIPLFDKWMGHRDSAAIHIDTTIEYTYDTIRTEKDTIVLVPVRRAHKGHHHNRGGLVRHKKKITETKVVKEPHTHTHVAARTPGQAYNTLLWAVVLLFIINVLGLIFWRIGENLNARLSSTIERTFIQRTFGHVLKLPLSFFAKRSSAALHKQIDQSEEISGTVTYFTKDILPEIISLVGIIGIMCWQNYVLAMLALSVIPFYLFITAISTKKLEMSLSGYYEKWEEVSARMQDALGGIKTVKLSGAEDREVKRLDEQANAAYKDYMKRSFLSNRYSFWQVLLTHLATALVLSYGGYLALHHRLTPGDVVMFVAYLDMLYAPIDRLAGIWADIQQNVTSVSRAFQLLDTGTTTSGGKALRLEKGRVEFRQVAFGYTAERQVLQGLSFIAEPGRITALVGTSGAGKTTTVDLLLKLFEPQKGEIYIDGQPLSSLDESSVRQQIGMVAADGAIFRGTLADNIRYKKPDATDEEVAAAATAAGLQGTLQRLPDGLRTLVGESGFGLSVGERQRIQIARVIVARPAILVMDEATANLDYNTEAEIRETISTLRKSSTIIVIAHRYSMVKDADHVLVLDAGQVIEEGTPEALIEKGGWFASFASAGEDEGPEETVEEKDEAAEEDDEQKEE